MKVNFLQRVEESEKMELREGPYRNGSHAKQGAFRLRRTEWNIDPGLGRS